MQRATFLTTTNRLSASPSRSVVHTTVKLVAVLVLATLAAAILSTDAISQEAKRDTMKKIEIARGPANAAALRRERAQFLHAQQQQYLIAMQQQLATSSLHSKDFTDLWIRWSATWPVVFQISAGTVARQRQAS